MHLTPREEERLLLFTAASLARTRLDRGAPLGATEAIAYICDNICELAWDGLHLEEIIRRVPWLLSAGQLLDGVADVVPAIQVEALFPWGTALVHIDRPFEHMTECSDRAGTAIPVEGDIALLSGRERQEIELHNSGEREVWISSHFPLEGLNRSLIAKEPLPRGYHLDLPAGEAVSVPPNESRKFVIVAFQRSVAAGFGGLS